MGVTDVQVRHMLNTRLRMYVSGEWTHRRRGSGKRGMDFNTWVSKSWTTEMINNPFPAPLGWKPEAGMPD